MADRAHHRNPARRHVTYESLILEREEIFLRAAPARHDDHVDFGYALQVRESLPNRLDRPGPLNACRSEEDVSPAPPERDVRDVVNNRPRAACHDADHARLSRQRPLAIGRKQTFFRELFFELLERLEKRAASDRLQAIGDELEPASGSPIRRPSAHAELRAIDGPFAHARRHVRPIHDRIDECVFFLVFEAKVEMPAWRRAGVYHFTFHKYGARHSALDDPTKNAPELRNRVTGRAFLACLACPAFVAGRLRRQLVEAKLALLRRTFSRLFRHVTRLPLVWLGRKCAPQRFGVSMGGSGAIWSQGTSFNGISNSVMPEFTKVLVANRGEIAVRVTRTLRELGLGAVAIYSDVDRAALHVRMADEAYSVGPAPASESYLRIDKVIDVAKKSGCDAIHPGYGFLSENPEFADACERAGITFIGPPAQAMRKMGSKTAARARMSEAGVPIVPGAHCDTQEEALAAAKKIGFPVMLKASAGGGGKGMRLVHAPEEMANAWERARSEAKKFFSDDTVYLEKAIVRPRHVEIQVLGDREGNVVHLFERDCSIQRRNQKVVEETPSPAASPELIAEMGRVAVQGAKAVGYFSAGTFEFLLDDDGKFYFLEMNTRLQVEHTVTELVTGLDLVREMVAIAQGERLGFAQNDLSPRGAAIQCRVYAEDPSNGFLPSPGRIERLVTPSGPGVRDDGGAYAGAEISSYYDPLISKLCVWAPTRGQAVARMRRALSEYIVTGIRTNLAFHDKLFCHPEFVAGRYDTGFIERHAEQLLGYATIPESDRQAVAVAIAIAASRLERATGVSVAEKGASGSQLSPWVAQHRARLART